VTNTVLLKKKIQERGVKIGFLVEKLNTSYHWLNQKIENKKDFKAWEIIALCEALEITDINERDQIFFAKNVEKSST
jgi:hypothetical protein